MVSGNVISDPENPNIVQSYNMTYEVALFITRKAAVIKTKTCVINYFIRVSFKQMSYDVGLLNHCQIINPYNHQTGE